MGRGENGEGGRGENGEGGRERMGREGKERLKSHPKLCFQHTMPHTPTQSVTVSHTVSVAHTHTHTHTVYPKILTHSFAITSTHSNFTLNFAFSI